MVAAAVAGAALRQLHGALPAGAVGALPAPQPASARERIAAARPRLRDPVSARAPRRRDPRLEQLFPHRSRLRDLPLVGLFRALAATPRGAADGAGGGMVARDDRAALLAAGAAVVRACALARADRRGAGAGTGHTRGRRGGAAGCCLCRDAALGGIVTGLTWFFAAALVAVLAARLARRISQRRHGVVRISYPDGRFAEVLRGTSVLEASRLAGIPHASVCGGRGRCSTCRVRVRAALPGPPPPSEEERRVLRRIGAGHNVRLACQLRPTTALEVMPLLPPFAGAAEGGRRVDVSQGSEREIAIMFADIRGFTALSETRLPYDVVFLLNRYFAAMGRAVEAAGGRVDKFIGDGIMALFGIEGSAEAGCRDALAAARAMSDRLVELNASLHDELERPLRIGIGIHVGHVIVGEMGYGGAASLTAIGDAVNIASRLETLTKEYDCELVVSQDVVARAGYDIGGFHWHRVEIRGRQEPLAAAMLDRAFDMPLLGSEVRMIEPAPV